MEEKSRCCCSSSLFWCLSCFQKNTPPRPNDPGPLPVGSGEIIDAEHPPTGHQPPTHLSTAPAAVLFPEDAPSSAFPAQYDPPPREGPPPCPAFTESTDASSSAVSMQTDPQPCEGPPPPPAFTKSADASSSALQSCEGRPTAPTQSIEAGASSSSGFPTMPIIVALGGDNVDFDRLANHISGLLKCIKEGGKSSETNPEHSLPVLSNVFTKLKDFISQAKDFVGGFFPEDTNEIVSDILRGMGNAHSALIGLVLVSNMLDRFAQVSENKQECLRLLEHMFYLAKVLKRIEKGRQLKEKMDEVIEATEMIVKGSIMCSHHMEFSKLRRYLSTKEIRNKLDELTRDIDNMEKRIGLSLLMDMYDNKAPLAVQYEQAAVGIEEEESQVMSLLKFNTEENALAVLLHGFGGMGKSTLASAVSLRVVSRFEGWKYSVVQMEANPNLIDIQKNILRDLMESDRIPEIRTSVIGQGELGRKLNEVQAFIYVDNVLSRTDLRQLLPFDMTKAKKVRFLLTAREEDVKYGCPSPSTPYSMQYIQLSQAMGFLEKYIKEELSGDQLNNIAEICGGIPLMLKLVVGFMNNHDPHDKEKAYDILMQQKERLADRRFQETERLFFAFDDLPDECKEPFLDICLFFAGWEWETVADIVGEAALQQLQQRALVTKDIKGVANIHDVILALGKRKAEGSRFKFATASKMKIFLDDQEKKSTEHIKGIWLTDNKDLSYIKAAKLDSMHNSLRVLSLGRLEGKFTKRFNQLVFFQAEVPHLPFDNVTRFDNLRYLSYQAQDMKLPKMPSDIRHLELDGRLQSHAFQIYPRDLQQLRKLRTLRVINFAGMEELPELPEKLGAPVNGLQELSLSYCNIERLPKSISNLKKSLRILRLDHCSNLRELPEDFGLLNLLEELNLQNCISLEKLPESLKDLSSLKLLDLSSCKNLLGLPSGIGNLTSLVKLHLNKCGKLHKIPENIERLKLASSMDMSYCSSLTEIPTSFCNLSFITHLSLEKCSSLKSLPNQFGKLANLIELNLCKCANLVELPEAFRQLKSLVKLNLSECTSLQRLCNDFQCLSSLRFLDLSSCDSLVELAEGFHYLPSLEDLYLSHCHMLQEKWMDNLVKTNKLQLVNIEGSRNLVKRWGEIQGEGDQSCPFVMYTGQDLRKEEKGKILQKLLQELEGLLTDKRGQHLRITDCSPGTLIIFHSYLEDDFPWPLKQETIDDIEKDFEMIYIGKHYNKLPVSVRCKILGHSPEIFDLGLMVVKLLLTMDADVLKRWLLTVDAAVRKSWLKGYIAEEPIYFQIQTVAEDKHWKVLSNSEMEECVLSKCGKYLRLKESAETSQGSNVELLKELFTTEEEETIHFFPKDCSSNKDLSENLEPFVLSIDKLEGKTILLEMRSATLYKDILLQSLIDIYCTRQEEELELEIISIPIMQSNTEFDASEIAREVPWLVLQNPRTIKKAVNYFLAKQSGWEGDDIWYRSIIWILKDGRISTCDPYVFVKLDWWVPRANFFRHENFEEWRKNKWNQLKNMSNLEFLLHHLEPVQDQKLKRIISRRKMTCIFSGNKEIIYPIVKALAKHRGRVNIIYIPEFGIKCQEKLRLTDNIYKRYDVLEMFTMSKDKLLKDICILDRDEAMRFWMHLFYFKKDINTAIDESDQEPCGMKKLLDSFGGPCMTFMDEDGKMVATCTGEFMKLISKQGKENRAKRLMQFLINFSKTGKPTDNDYSMRFFFENAQTTDAIDQETVHVDLKEIMEDITLLFKLEKLYKNGSYWPKSLINCFRLKEHWPETPESFIKLREFFSGDVKVIHDSHTWKLPAEILEYLLEGMKPVDYPVACLLVISIVLERCLETVFTKRDDCLSFLSKICRLAEILIRLSQGPSHSIRRARKGREGAALLMLCSIVCCSQIDATVFNGFFAKMPIRALVIKIHSFVHAMVFYTPLIKKGKGHRRIQQESPTTGKTIPPL